MNVNGQILSTLIRGLLLVEEPLKTFSYRIFHLVLERLTINFICKKFQIYKLFYSLNDLHSLVITNEVRFALSFYIGH
jgi:hypothetical protein